MAGRKYERLAIEDFGRHLLDTNDLDPVYVALHRMDVDEAQLKRWLLAYWCLYHVGAACYLSEHRDQEFWSELYRAADNTEPTPLGTRWPRGHERRHFRGDAARKAVKSLSSQYKAPEEMVDYCASSPGCSFPEIAKRVKQHRLFGPWISFKVGDMLERLGLCHVDFDQAAIFMFKDPTKAALKLWKQRAGVPEDAVVKEHSKAIQQVVAHLESVFNSYSAPPRYERTVNLQEVETVLCKWKSHMNGHYPLYNDIDDIRGGLIDWYDHSATSYQFLNAMPKGSPA